MTQMLEMPHTLEEVRAERARRSLEEYVAQAFEVLEPETPFHKNWHVGAICYHLEAVANGEIRHLLINVPPGFLKSLLTSVFFPTWQWGPRGMPHIRYITASKKRGVATRDTLRARRLILSDWYQRNFGALKISNEDLPDPVFAMSSDQNQKTRYDNDRGGYRIAMSVGSGTGERADCVIFDDPHELDDYYYPEALRTSVEYNNLTLDSRFAHREESAKIVVQQRIAPGDVSDDILQKMEAGGRQYEVLCLPMRHDPAYQLALHSNNKLGWLDPRKEAGELLDPERYSEHSVEEDEVTYGNQAPAILGQKPDDAATASFRREWFADDRYDPAGDRFFNKTYRRYIMWDTAEEDKPQNARSAMIVGDLMPDYRLAIRYAFADRLTFDKLPDTITEEARPFARDKKLRVVCIEKKSTGGPAIQVLRTTAEPWLATRVEGVPAVNSKEQEWGAAAVWCRRGCIMLPEPDEESPWLPMVEHELFSARPSTLDLRDAFAKLINYVERSTAEELQEQRAHGRYRGHAYAGGVFSERWRKITRRKANAEAKPEDGGRVA